MICATCGHPIDPLDPDAFSEEASICGECARARNFDQLRWELDAAEDDESDEADE